MSPKKARIPESDLSHGSVTTMYANEADYIRWQLHKRHPVRPYHGKCVYLPQIWVEWIDEDGGQRWTPKPHILWFYGRSRRQRFGYEVIVPTAWSTRVGEYLRYDGLTAKLDHIRKTQHTVFCDEPESVDTPPTSRTNKVRSHFSSWFSEEMQFSHFNRIILRGRHHQHVPSSQGHEKHARQSEYEKVQRHLG